MTWGNVEAVRQLMHMIAYRKGFGNLLAEGIMRASRKIGGEAAKAAIYTLKGNSPRGHDHRTIWGEMFDTVVSNTGTIETHTSLTTAPPYKASAGNPYGTSRGVALTKGILIWEDCLGNCRFNTGFDLTITSEAVSAVTGWEISPEAAKTIGSRVINLMKVFNLRAGIKKEHDAPSDRYGSTPVDGPTKGISIHHHFNSMLRNYYKLMGWDEDTGKPLPETLRKLGLEHIIKDI
jgi:aldehyde:ferredoxin oxidoreductase